MISKLRLKFVIVTTTLMLVIFGGIFLVTHFYNSYWNGMEAFDMLDSISDSGIFSSDFDTDELEELGFDMNDTDNSIVMIKLDNSGEVVSRSVLGDGKDMHIPVKVLNSILKRKASDYKIGKYIYSYRQNSDMTAQILIMKASNRKYGIIKIIGTSILLMAGIMVLIAITFALSKFVTDPANKALLREKRFISDASHELKTPLGAISINAQVLEAQGIDNLYLRNIVTEAERMGRLIERLLTLSRLDEGEHLPQTQISFSELVEEMALTYESIAYEKSISYRYYIEKNIIIKGSEDELRQLMAILIDNAIKNTPESGMIEITCARSRSKVNLKIKNTGDIIPEEHLAHLFERFYTTDSSRKDNSFGLGLAIAKSIVELHKGKIEVTSSEDEKTVFTVSFSQ